MPRRRRSKKWISWLIILILLVVAFVVVFSVWDNYFNGNKDQSGEVKEESSIQEERDSGEGIKDDDKEDDKKIKQYEGDDPNDADELSGVVTYAGIVDDVVMVRANIDQYLGGGSCKLSLLSGDTVVYEEMSSIVSAASTATCEGFDISTKQLSIGDYKIIIKIEANGKTGTIRGEITI